MLLRQLKGLTKFEVILLSLSVSVVIISYCFSNEKDFLNLIASIVGVTSLIYVSKGYVLGEMLNIVFSILYGIVSIKFHYYGELMSYAFMALPMSVIAIISWIKNPYEDSDEVTVGNVSKKNIIQLIISTLVVVPTFYFILKYFNTSNLLISTLSIATSFIAAYLTYLRSEYYALGYGINDIVLIVLWILAAIEDISYLPMVFCFIMFLVNDIYGLYNWKKMRKRQNN